MKYKYLKPYQRPDSYIGPDYYDYYPFLGRSRDSKSWEESNFHCGLKAIGGESDTVLVIRDNHWAVGWVETIYIHKDNATALETADKIHEDLQDYPIIDDDDLSEREWNTAQDYWETLDEDEKKELCTRFDCTFLPSGEFPQDDNGGLMDYLRD